MARPKVHDLAGRAELSAVNGAINAYYTSLDNVKDIQSEIGERIDSPRIAFLSERRCQCLDREWRHHH